MAVYGYGKVHAQLLAQGWDPGEVGRDQVMNIMRELGVQGVRRGRMPAATRPAKGCGRQTRPGEQGIRGMRAEPSSRGRHHLRAHDHGRFGYTAFVTDVYARRVVGWACARSMDTRGLPLQALEQAISWAARHGGTRGRPSQRPRLPVHQPRVHHQGDGTRDAALDRHRGRLLRQRHGRVRRRRVQDRAGLAVQTLPGRGRPGAGDVPVGLVVELETPPRQPGLQDTGTGRNRVLSTSGDTSRHTMRAEQKPGQFIGKQHVVMKSVMFERIVLASFCMKRRLYRASASQSCDSAHCHAPR